MLKMLINWILSAVCLMITAYLVTGFKVDSFTSALIASVVIGFFNILLRPILLLVTLPINILTLGLFTFVVNAIILKIASGLLGGFQIDSWFTALIGAFVLTVVNWIMFKFFDTQEG